MINLLVACIRLSLAITQNQDEYQEQKPYRNLIFYNQQYMKVMWFCHNLTHPIIHNWKMFYFKINSV